MAVTAARVVPALGEELVEVDVEGERAWNWREERWPRNGGGPSSRSACLHVLPFAVVSLCLCRRKRRVVPCRAARAPRAFRRSTPATYTPMRSSHRVRPRTPASQSPLPPRPQPRARSARAVCRDASKNCRRGNHLLGVSVMRSVHYGPRFRPRRIPSSMTVEGEAGRVFA